MRKFFTQINFKTIVLLIFLLSTITMSARDFVVVIDAGHGGHDGGAVGVYAKEKDINLAVAKALGEKIDSECPNVKVVYTRSTDKFISLQQRANIANKAGGDLFISIHVNSVDYNTAGREKVSGASVFTLGLHKSDDNLAVAKRENSVIKLEKDYSTTYSGFDPQSTESYIIFEMNQNKHMLQSIEFAGAVQKELIKTAKRSDKGIRQAGFWVLWATSMPSVLIELDFICNPTQEEFLSSKAGQDKLATSIFNAFKKYHSTYAKLISEETEVTKKSTNKTVTKKQAPKSKQNNSTTSTEQNQNKSTKKGNKKAAEPKTPSVKSEKVPSINNNVDTDKIVYRIQILISDKDLDNNSKLFKGLTPIWKYRDGKIWKYTYDETTSFDEAKKMLKKAKDKFPQAFIVKFKNGKRIK